MTRFLRLWCLFTKQSIVGSGCRAKTSQRIYFACTEAKSAKPSYLKKKKNGDSGIAFLASIVIAAEG